MEPIAATKPGKVVSRREGKGGEVKGGEGITIDYHAVGHITRNWS